MKMTSMKINFLKKERRSVALQNLGNTLFGEQIDIVILE